MPTKRAIDQVVMDFLEERIITRFGVPAKIVTNNTKAFNSMALALMCCDYVIMLARSSNYYPQRNGQVESNNKNLIKIIKKTVGENKQNWDSKIKYALWAGHTTIKTSTSYSPFQLLYRVEAKLNIQLKLHVLECLKTFPNQQDVIIQSRIDQIIEVDEMHRRAID